MKNQKGSNGVFAVAAVQKTDEWYGFLSALDSESFEKQIETIKKKSLYNTDIDPEYGRQLLTLSTCYASNNDGRLIVAAIQIS